MVNPLKTSASSLAGVFYLLNKIHTKNEDSLLLKDDSLLSVLSHSRTSLLIAIVYLCDPIFIMQLFSFVSNLKSFIQGEKKTSHKIAFIPTMGALHPGHISLIETGKKYAEQTVCSIYINPRQFNNPEDLKKYPRSLEHDARLAEQAHCDVLFIPNDEEIYPNGLDTSIQLDLADLDQSMEGLFRPGHFMGMLQVVKRLLDIINPDYLIMGQKDFQQFRLVQHMIDELQLPVKLIVAPTIRESDGLAMSSRNQRLNAEERKKALAIYKNLLYLKEHLATSNIEILQIQVMLALKEAGLNPEYVEIVDGLTMKKVIHPELHDCIVACTAAWAGEIRLIDNLILKGSFN